MQLKNSNIKDGNEVSEEKKKVVHVTARGCSPRLFLIDHFSYMLSKGFDVTLVCRNDEDTRYCVEATGVRHIPVLFKQNISPVSDLLCLCRLWRLFRKIRPKIVDAHMSKAGLLGMLASRFAGVGIRIYHNHGMALLSATGWKYWLLKLTESIACACATEVIFVSGSNRDDASKLGICHPQKSVVLGPGTICGVDTGKFDPQAAAERGLELRRKAEIPYKSHLVGFVGRIVPHKGVQTILQAWRILPSEIRTNAYLCFFGGYENAPMRELVEQACREPDLNVKYMGFSNDMAAWYSAMTLLVQPSWHEGWGYNVLEAACSGVPAVGTEISATVDAIVNGQTGLLVGVNDPVAMAEAIVQLLKDDQLRKRFGHAARSRTLENFSKDKILPLLTREYVRLLSSRKLPVDE